VSVCTDVCYFVSGIERFIVLDIIEGLVERQKQDNDLRHRLEESEAKVALLEIELAQCSTESDTGSGLSMNTVMAQGSVGPGAGL
jgi:hypothetical protein